MFPEAVYPTLAPVVLGVTGRVDLVGAAETCHAVGVGRGSRQVAETCPSRGVWFSPDAETYYPQLSGVWFSRSDGHRVLVHYVVTNAVNYHCRDHSSYPGCLVWGPGSSSRHVCRSRTTTRLLLAAATSFSTWRVYSSP